MQQIIKTYLLAVKMHLVNINCAPTSVISWLLMKITTLSPILRPFRLGLILPKTWLICMLPFWESLSCFPHLLFSFNNTKLNDSTYAQKFNSTWLYTLQYARQSKLSAWRFISLILKKRGIKSYNSHISKQTHKNQSDNTCLLFIVFGQNLTHAHV